MCTLLKRSADIEEECFFMGKMKKNTERIISELKKKYEFVFRVLRVKRINL